MANRILLRDGQSTSADMLQRILGGLTAGIGAISGVGSGYATGGVGKMNSTWLGVGAPTGHMVVTADGATMVLTVTPGWAYVLRDVGTSTYDPRTILVEQDANLTATVTANATGGVRNDTVCLKVDMTSSPSSDGGNLVSIAIIAGAGGGGLSNAPADGNLYLPLANVAVANAAVSIAQGNVTDKRVWLPSDINPFKARAYTNAAQAAITASTFTKVVFQVQDFDPNANFDLANNRYYAGAGGYYIANGLVTFAGSLTAMTRYISAIYKNGVEIPGCRGETVTSETTAIQNIGLVTATPPVKLQAGDYLELFAYSTASQQLGTLGDINSLSIHLLSGL